MNIKGPMFFKFTLSEPVDNLYFFILNLPAFYLRFSRFSQREPGVGPYILFVTVNL